MSDAPPLVPPPVPIELLDKMKEDREKRIQEINSRDDWYNGYFADINLMSNETLYDKFVSLTEEQKEDLKNNVGEENYYKIYDKITAYLTKKLELLKESNKKLLDEGEALQTHKGGSKLTRRRRKKRNQTNRKKNGLYADEYFKWT